MLFRRLLFFASLCLGSASLSAQTQWTAIPPGVSRTLWGVCYGGGQFVAVGEGGTILTSPDGLAWTARASGTSGWLTAVAFALNNYVAVGDAGTVLWSRDAIVWENVTQRASRPPTNRLNAVSFNAATSEFLVYGEHDSAIAVRLPIQLDLNDAARGGALGSWWRTSASGLERIVVGGEAGLSVLEFVDRLSPGNTRGLAITLARNVSGLVFDRDGFTAVGGAGAILTSADATHWALQPSGTTANLHGLARFNNTLIAVGEGGTILSQDELGLWQRRPAPTGELLLAIAASETAAVVVGGSGTILRTTPTAMAPTIVSAPASLTETLGGAASFTVRANGSLPLAYQWTRNGSALAGETRDTLTRAPLVATDAGSYAVTVTNSAGRVVSSLAALNLLPAPPAVVDESFHADAALDGMVRALLPLADGSLLVATSPRSRSDPMIARLQKLRPDGSLDRSFAENTFTVTDPASFPFIAQILLQPDGKFLVGGEFALRNGQPGVNFLRLNADGSRDATFAPAPEAFARPTAALTLSADGRVLVANNGTLPVCLLPDGTLDAAFRPAPQPRAEIPQFPGQLRDRFIRTVATTSQGKFYVVGVANLQFTLIQGRVPDSYLVRLNADGSIDPAFTAQSWRGDALTLRVLNDGSVQVVQQVPGDAPIGLGFGNWAGRLARFRSDGTPFPGYSSPTLPWLRASYLYPDGSALYSANTQQAPVRLSTTGAVDPSFTGGIGDVWAFAATADGHVLVGGDFTLYNAKPANRVARLNAVPNGTVNPPRLLALASDTPTAHVGESIVVRAAVVGSAELTYDWNIDNRETVRTASPVFTFSAHQFQSMTTLRLTVRNPRGEATNALLTFTLLPAAPTIASQPTRISSQTGRDVALQLGKNSDSGPATVEWRRNGVLLARPTEPASDGLTLRLTAVTAADAGVYTATARNILGDAVTAAPIVLTIDDTSRFTNLSTRAFAGTGENAVIAGFTIAGTGPRSVLIRGVGQGLAKLNVPTPLADAQVLVFRGSAATNWGNFDWDNTAPEIVASLRDTFTRTGAFPLEAGSKDAALIASLSPGSYTVQLTGQDGGSGIGLVEIYEADNETEHMLNLSTRAPVSPAIPAIAGFAIRGVVAKRMLLRAAGPALGSFAVARPLPNPRLIVKDAAGATIAANDDWETLSDSAALRTAANAVGAFPFAAGSKDAALIVTLSPGNYTMLAETADGLSGVALLEVYELP